MPKILLVDDDPQSLDSTRRILELSEYEVVTAIDGQQALDLMRPGTSRVDFDLVLTDVRMPRLGGLEFLRALSLCGEKTPVILMTAFGRVEDAVWAMKLGAVDFLTKPFKRQALLQTVENALKRAKRSGPIVPNEAPHAFIGKSTQIQNLRKTLEQVAPTSAAVLITGESGTGKELVARFLHDRSARAQGPFIALNCAALPENLIEAELFGYEKGAFTGAHASKMGLFESANGGTLLLDEIGDMPLSLQAKLLRVLQESEVRRVGATSSKKIDVRVLAATHQDLKTRVAQGAFRQDLLYRLEVIGIVVPSLRERGDDIQDLAFHFFHHSLERHQKQLTGISAEALESLLHHPWPGNVRELANVIERAVVMAQGPQIEQTDLPVHLHNMENPAEKNRTGAGSSISVPLGTSLRDVEDLLIRKTLEATSGDKNMTARILGINSRTIYRKLDKRPTRE